MANEQAAIAYKRETSQIVDKSLGGVSRIILVELYVVRMHYYSLTCLSFPLSSVRSCSFGHVPLRQVMSHYRSCVFAWQQRTFQMSI